MAACPPLADAWADSAPSVASAASPPPIVSEAARQGQAIELRHSFGEQPQARARPLDGLVAGLDGPWFGTTLRGGSHAVGTTHRFDPDGTFSVLHSFAGGADGADPVAPPVLGADGALYGTTSAGGEPGRRGLGTLWRLDSNGDYQVPHAFGLREGDGAAPLSRPLAASDRHPYGVTPYGGRFGAGVLYRVSPGGEVRLLQAPDASWWGITHLGCCAGGLRRSSRGTTVSPRPSLATRALMRPALLLAALGAAWVPDAAASPAQNEPCRVELLYAFGATEADGARPADGVMLSRGAGLLGVAAAGGSHGFGQLFRLGLDGRQHPLHDFSGAPDDGADPQASPTPDGAGGLYGTTQRGGAHRMGTVYHLDATGSLRLLHSFGGPPHDGGQPQAPLLRGADGHWYGSTRAGGVHGGGMLFRIRGDGAYEPLAHFGAGTGLSDPAGPLVRGSDGAILGVASAGGQHGRGGVFRYQPGDSTLRTLVSLGAADDCAMPMAGLMRARDGRLLGTAYAGGPANAGCVFALGQNGSYRVLYALRGADDGAQPLSLPLETGDGILYLTSSLGAAHGDGALLRLDPSDGTVAVLHAFGQADVSVPSGRLAQAADGRIYGSAPYGGTHDLGGVFRAACRAAPPAALSEAPSTAPPAAPPAAPSAAGLNAR